MNQGRINKLIEWIKQNYHYSEEQLKGAALKGGWTEEEFSAAMSAVKEKLSKFENEVKGVGLRFLAFTIDSIIFGIIFFVFLKLFGSKHIGGCGYGSHIGFTFSKNGKKVFYGLCGFSAWFYYGIVFLYYAILEWKFGATLGKLLAGIRVIKTNGAPLDLKASIIRNILRLVDFLPSFYLVGAILIWTSKFKQRLGDKLANTIVVGKKK